MREAPPAETEADPAAFRQALGSFATGVTIVTTRSSEGQDIGLTANSFNSVSLQPPMVLWSLAKSSKSLAAFAQAEYFAVHILAADQEPLSNLFATRGADKFAGLELDRGAGGVPLLEGCSARFVCRTAFRYEGGDHEIFVGEVLKFEHFARTPLVFHGGRYATAVQKPAPAIADSREIDSSYGHSALHYLLGRAHHQLERKLIPELTARGLTLEEYGLLSLLAATDRCRVAELQALLAASGRPLDAAGAQRLSARGLTRLEGEAGASALRLTDAGRKLVIELSAAAKAIEEDALEQLDHSELQVLKDLLERLIVRTGPNPG